MYSVIKDRTEGLMNKVHFGSTMFLNPLKLAIIITLFLQCQCLPTLTYIQILLSASNNREGSTVWSTEAEGGLFLITTS